MKAVIGKYFIGIGVALLVGFLALPQPAQAAMPTVKTVPWDPANPTAPHTTYPLDALNEVNIVMAATADWPAGAPNSFRAVWNFADGSPNVTINPIANRYNISTLHQYPPGAAGGTTWTATVTVIDNVTGESASANYYVIQQANNLQSRVNVAIDHGLWYLHKTMWRTTSGVVPIGGWDGLMACGGFGNFACINTGGIDASNIQAFQVKGHYENGPASDPYTDDVKRGLARMMQYLVSEAVGPKTYNYAFPSCPVPNCTLTFDGNANTRRIRESANAAYQTGMFMDSIVATSNPAGTAALGGANIVGQTYLNIVQDLADYENHCQYTTSFGGGWYYSCQGYNDNSISQWAAIGLIGGIRGFGISPGTIAYPNIIKDANRVWLNNSDTLDSAVSAYFGYQSSGWVWGPWATTPSGMVQLAMDGIGRGDSLWDRAESYYRNGFCNATSSGAYYAPRAYTYGLFSFTKSMLLHNPLGVLTPITLLHSNTAGVLDIDWYNAVGPESGGPAPCDGVAQTLVKRQGGGAPGGGTPNPANPQGGYWYGNNYYSEQNPFETSWSIIMLRRTVFVACVNNLTGRGTPLGRAPARIDLTWTGVGGAVSYNVLRGAASGGPYVLIGNTTLPAYSDTAGLSNSTTYYYVLQPLNAAGGEICQSNQATVAIPAGR